MIEVDEFLLARIAEDEAVAREAEAEWTDDLSGGPAPVVGIERFLAECETKRRIVHQASLAAGDVIREAPGAGYAAQALIRALYALATVYADHPDFREEWRR